MGKTFKKSFEVKKSCRKRVVGLNINDSKKNGPKGSYAPTPRDNIHVYYHNIQTSPLKPLGQLKPNLCEASIGWGTNVYINNLGHMTKMATMPIYGENPSKIYFSETNRLISMKLGVKHQWRKYYNVYKS